MSDVHSLLMSAILKNPAKGPWQGRVALLWAIIDYSFYATDILCVVFHPCGIVTILSLKKVMHRIFIFGLAMAILRGFLYANTARRLYDFTHRTTSDALCQAKN